jgi:hypothetical protein
VPAPQAVIVDAFTFINFYMHHHEWKWELEREWPGQPVRQVWRLTRGDSQLKLCRDTIQWAFDMSAPMTYSSLSECAEKSRAGRVALLRTQWNLQTPNWDTARTAELASTASDQFDLKPLVVQESGGDVYGEFLALNPADLIACTEPPPPPQDLRTTSNTGRAVALAWSRTRNRRVSAILEAGDRPGLSNMIRQDLGRTETYTNNEVPPRTYYVRIRNWNACGTGAPSNELVIVVN